VTVPPLAAGFESLVPLMQELRMGSRVSLETVGGEQRGAMGSPTLASISFRCRDLRDSASGFVSLRSPVFCFRLLYGMCSCGSAGGWAWILTKQQSLFGESLCFGPRVWIRGDGLLGDSYP